MTLQRRSFSGAEDLRLMQESQRKWITRAGSECGYLSSGDIAHRIYNGGRNRDPGAIVQLWMDAEGLSVRDTDLAG